jgi:hypothetical protein
MMERLLEVEVTENGTLFEEIEYICTMTGFRRRFLIHHLGEGFFQSVELLFVGGARGGRKYRERKEAHGQVR